MSITNQNKSLQLDDIARELNLSTSTISRVISGKGKISKATRERVQQYIQQHNYRPNGIARSLATRKTNSIGVVIPGDAFLHVTPFFQVSLMGICERAVKLDYDVAVTSATEKDISYLRRLVEKRVVDGVILMRTLVNDTSAQYLSSQNIPFVTIGSYFDDTVAQVDAKHKQAACELTGRLIDQNNSPVGILIGGMNYVVNTNRYKGFLQAHQDRGLTPDESIVFTDKITQESIVSAVDILLDRAKVIICGDDNICLTALTRIAERGMAIPQQIKIASLYGNAILSNYTKPVTAVEVDDATLGGEAAACLIELIEKKTPSKVVSLGYSIKYRESTGN